MDENADVLFILRKNGSENTAVLQRNFNAVEIESKGLNRTRLELIKTFGITIKSLLGSYKIIKNYKPDIILGTGGYVSFAPLIVSLILKIPTFVHESNITPGLVTKIISRCGGTVLLNFEVSKKQLPNAKKCITVGNPLLSDFSKITKKQARTKLKLSDNDRLIISFGGSGGSKKLNDVIIDVMDKYIKNQSNIRHIHATGEKYYRAIAEKYCHLTRDYGKLKIVPKIDDMALHMAAADIVICRCGATTLSELSATGKAAILIPSPNVTDNHQYKNGKFLSDNHAAVLIEESQLSQELLIEKINLILNSKIIKQTLETNIKKTKKQDSAKIISKIIMNYAK